MFLSLAIVAAGVLIAIPAKAVYQTTPDPTWGVNGRVYTTLKLGDRIYLGGTFTRAVPPSGSSASSVARPGLVALDAQTGELDMSWNPAVSGPAHSTLGVHTLAASPDGTKIFAGGDFSNVDGTAHKNLVSIDAASGEVNQNWKVNANYPVWTLAALGTRLYIGGAFSKLIVNGSNKWQGRLAAVDLNTGSFDGAWRPKPGNTVKTIELSPDGNTMYVGGNFQVFSDQPRLWLAAIETATGNLSSTWVPSDGIFDFSPCGNGCIIDIEANSTHVYAAAGGKFGNKMMALDAVTGALQWEKAGNGDYQAVSIKGNEVYAGGHFEQTANRTDRARFVVFDALTGEVSNFYIPQNGSMGIWSVKATSDRLYLGGDFTTVAGTAQSGFAQFTEQLTVSPDASWGFNGRVTSTLRLGDRIYVAGEFTSAIPPEGSSLAPVDRFKLAVIDANTGELDMTWDPAVTGPALNKLAVQSLAASSDGTKIFAGGDFGTVDGVPHKNVVAIDAVTGEVDESWKVSANFPVWALGTDATRLYMGGAFTKVTFDGQVINKNRLAAVEQATGANVPGWSPSPDGVVKALEMSADGALMYIGGNFRNVSGQPRMWLAAIESATGTLSPTWVPADGISDFAPCGPGCILDLESSLTHVFAAVAGTGDKVMVLDAVTGSLSWQATANGNVQGLSHSEGELYVGGEFTEVAGRTDRARFIVFEVLTGAVTDYYVSVNSNTGIWWLDKQGDQLYLGGDFTNVSGREQSGFAMVTVPGGVDPTPSPSPTEPSPSPTTEPSPSPSPTAEPSPSPSSTAEPSPTPSTEPGTSPSP